MYKIIVVLSVLATLAACAPQARIVGGGDAEDHQFPFMCSLRRMEDMKHICGCVIVGSQHVLTAANCVKTTPAGGFHVVVGSNSLSSGGDHMGVEAIWVHEDYNPKTFENNLAALKLVEKITNKDSRPIPVGTVVTPGEVDVVLIGWGTTSSSETEPVDKLQFLELKTLDNEKCASALSPNPVSDNEICALEVGAGACRGDGGDPLIANNQLIGLLSWGRPCANNVPDVYVRISSFADWIFDKIGM